MSIVHSTSYHAKVYCFIVIIILGCCSCAHKKQKAKTAHNYYNLAMLELAEPSQNIGSWKKALSYIDTALKTDQKAEYYALKATILFVLGNQDKSKDLFKQALKVSENKTVRQEILNNYACVLAEGGEKEEALRLWDLLVINEDYLTPEVALVNKGKVLMEQGLAEQASQNFAQAVGYAPGYLDAQYFLALARMQLNDVNGARDSIKTILYLDKDHQGALLLAKKIITK